MAVLATYRLGNRNRLLEKQRLDNEMQRFREEQDRRLDELVRSLEQEYRRLLLAEKLAAYRDIGPAFGLATELARSVLRQDPPLLVEWDKYRQRTLKDLHEAITANLHVVDRRLTAAYTRFELAVTALRMAIPGSSQANKATSEKSVVMSEVSAASDRFVEVMREDLGVKHMETGELEEFLFPRQVGRSLQST